MIFSSRIHACVPLVWLAEGHGRLRPLPQKEVRLAAFDRPPEEAEIDKKNFPPQAFSTAILCRPSSSCQPIVRRPTHPQSEVLDHRSRLPSLKIIMVPTPPRRRDTASSQASQTSMSLRRRATKPFTSAKPSSSSTTCYEQVPSYRLRWEIIKSWLETRYPDLHFNHKTLNLVDDKFIFEVPIGQKLTEVSLQGFEMAVSSCFECCCDGVTAIPC